MENSSRNGRASQLSSSGPLKQRRSGYEPSDTETEWQESPWLDHNWKHLDLGFGDLKTPTPRNASPLKQSQSPRNPSPLKKTVSPRSTSPLTVNRRLASKFENHGGSSPPRRRHSKSPYKPRRDDGNRSILPPPPGFDFRRNISPFSKSERWRNISPYKAGREEQNLDQDEAENSNRKQNHLPEDGRATEKSSYTRRSATAPRQRMRETEQHNRNGNIEQRGERTPSPLSRNMVRKQREASHMKTPSIGEINEMVGNAKLSGVPLSKAPTFESTDSISPGDIFFSRDCTALAMPKNVLPKNSGFESLFNSKPKMFSGNESVPQQPMMLNGSYGHNGRGISSGNGSSRTTTTSSSVVSRQFSSESSKMSNVSGRTTQSMKKFTANRRKSQTEGAWFACMRKGTCSTSKSPEHRPQFDEASFIEKAFVVEHLRPFWADKHQPGSLNGFTCHKQEAQLLKQLVSHDICPHILFKGPSGSGKKALTMALLREIYGDPSWNISHDLRYFQIQEKRTTQVVIPLTSSAHHVELNVNSEPNARYALMALVKEISNNFAITPEVSNVNFKTDYKVILLYEVDKAAENIQHLIKWIMDCYTDSCKLILCCEDDVEILESVKTRCKVIKVDAPVTHEIMEVLIQIARKEDIDLSMSFAAKIATKSKQNLRKAIMALEACKAHNYPFVDDQPIPLGWEEILVELGAEILANPSPNRLFFIRGKFQKLLVDFVHPKLILQKLVEQFLKGVEASLKRELYYWHAYYDKRLPTGTSALLKLEEFVAKFMSIYRKSFSNHRYM